jgi:ABC-type phosphate transport system substrate-binding protein
MKRIIFIITFILSLSAWAKPYFIVHSSNPVSALSQAEVKKIFLGESSLWENNEEEIQVVDYKKGVKEKKEFIKNFLKVSPFYLYKKWIRASLQGDGLPVKLFETDDQAIDFIKQNPTAIGYIYNRIKRTENIKALKITP